MVEQIARQLHPDHITEEHAMAASQVFRMATTNLFVERELLPWASVLTVEDVMGVLWLIGMISFNNSAKPLCWNPKSPLQTPEQEGVTKLVRLVHGLPVTHHRGGQKIAFTPYPSNAQT